MAPASGESTNLEEMLLALVAEDDAAPSSSQQDKDQKRSIRKRSRGQDSGRDDSDEEYDDDEGSRSRGGSARRIRGNSSKRGRGRHQTSSDEESEEDEEDEEEDEFLASERAQVKLWGDDLMGDEEDRKKLQAMSELDREMLLADRQKRRDALQEREQLRKRLNNQSRLNQLKSDDEGRRLSDRDKKSKSLDQLRRKRDGRSDSRRHSDDEDDDDDADGSHKRDRSRSRGDKDADTPKQKETVNFEHALTAQVKRDDVIRWMHASFFIKTIVGSYVRIGVGVDRATGKDVYRVAQVVGTQPSKKPYSVGNATTSTDVVLEHGKARRHFGMNIVSTKPFTESEWRRYERTMINDKLSLPSIDFIKRKSVEIEKARNHVFTNEEINEMIKRKSETSDKPKNIQLALVKARMEYANLKDHGDPDAVDALDQKIKNLEELLSMKSTNEPSQLDVYAKLNERNRKSNISEARVAEKKMSEERKKNGASESDPFTRRKTAPLHVVQGGATKAEERSRLADAAKSSQPSTPNRLPVRRTLLSVPKLPAPSRSPKMSPSKAITAATVDDSFLDSIDVSALEAELGI